MRRVLSFLMLFSGSGLAFADAGGWMAGLRDDLPISRVTLPGTHDSGALIEPLKGTAKTQTATIAEQLEFGVRLLDIRCRHVGDAFRIHHGMVDQKQGFGEVLASVTGFLAANPTEFVVMSVKEEFKAKDNRRSFPKTFAASIGRDRERWYLGDEIPKVGEVRGKIVLLRRFAGVDKLGLNASRWPGNRTFEAEGLWVQDQFKVEDVARKWEAVVEGLAVARESKDAGVVHLNFTSGVGPGRLGVPDIRVVADAINPKLADRLRDREMGFSGWLMMDFATPELVELVFGQNELARADGR